MGTSRAFHSGCPIPATIAGFAFAGSTHALQVSAKSGNSCFSALALLTRLMYKQRPHSLVENRFASVWGGGGEKLTAVLFRWSAAGTRRRTRGFAPMRAEACGVSG